MSTWVLVEMEGDAGIIQFIPDQLCNLASHRLDGFRPPGSWIACTWGGKGWLVGLVYWREILPLLHLLSGRLHFSKLLKDPYPKTSTNFPTTSSSSSPAKVLQAPDCYQLEHFEDQTIYLFFLVTNQIRELRAVAVIG